MGLQAAVFSPDIGILVLRSERDAHLRTPHLPTKMRGRLRADLRGIFRSVHQFPAYHRPISPRNGERAHTDKRDTLRRSAAATGRLFTWLA
jgi:hypothetical protein